MSGPTPAGPFICYDDDLTHAHSTCTNHVLDFLKTELVLPRTMLFCPHAHTPSVVDLNVFTNYLMLYLQEVNLSPSPRVWVSEEQRAWEVIMCHF